MLKYLINTGMLIYAIVLCSPAPSAAGRIKVVATLPDLAAIAGEVGGEHVDVLSICKGYQDPHYIQAKPSHARKMQDADLLVMNGLELEVGWLPSLIDAARNPRIRPGKAGCLDCSQGIVPLEAAPGGVDRSEGDIHPLGNPHYLLDPRNGIIVADIISGRLAEIDPGNSEAYSDNYATFKAAMEKRISNWEKMAKPLAGKVIITYHKQWEYFTEWLGLSIADYIENRPGIPPSPKHLKNLIEKMNRGRIEMILAANYVDLTQAGNAAELSGAELVVLPVLVGGEDEVKTCSGLFDFLIDRLVKSYERSAGNG